MEEREKHESWAVNTNRHGTERWNPKYLQEKNRELKRNKKQQQIMNRKQ